MTHIKICGLTQAQDILVVNTVKPEFIGFVFAVSPRQVTIDQALFLKGQLDLHIRAVGVFVNATVDYIQHCVQDNIIDIVQLHGNEDEAYMRQLRQKIAVPIIQARRVETTSDIVPTIADFVLLDSKQEGVYGGSGETFDWSVIPPQKKPFILAGGITNDNVEKAIRQVAPFAIDISSGVETDGKKDPKKIVEFIHKVRSI